MAAKAVGIMLHWSRPVEIRAQKWPRVATTAVNLYM